MTQPTGKICPQCGLLAVITSPQCVRCGHQFRTQFYSGSDDQTQAVYPAQQPQYSRPNASPQGYYDPGMPPQQVQVPQQDATGYIIGAIMLSLVSLLFFPIFTGAGAIVCGYKVKAAGKEGLGIGLMVVSGGCMFIGIVIGMMVGIRTAMHR